MSRSRIPSHLASVIRYEPTKIARNVDSSISYTCVHPRFRGMRSLIFRKPPRSMTPTPFRAARISSGFFSQIGYGMRSIFPAISSMWYVPSSRIARFMSWKSSCIRVRARTLPSSSLYISHLTILPKTCLWCFARAVIASKSISPVSLAQFPEDRQVPDVHLELVRAVLRRFDDHGQRAEPPVGHDPSERGQTDRPLADVEMPVHPAAARGLRVVQMPHPDARKDPGPPELVE